MSIVDTAPRSIGDHASEAAIRKAAVRLLPLLALGYGVAYMDRVNISFAALQMNADLHFSATVYGLGGGLFFLSYAVLEVPSNLMLVRFGARRWLARIMLTWGILAAGMMFVKTPFQFYIMRFLLGAAEAGFFPGVVLYLSYWFPASYRGRAVSRFYFAYPLSSVVMGALAGPLLGLGGRGELAGWQWLFLIEGLPAVILSIVIFRMLPDGPAYASWLTDRERDALAQRLDADVSARRSHSLRETFRALRDRRIAVFGVANLLIMGANYSANLSAPLVIRDVTGWSATQIGVLVSVSFVAAAVAMVLVGSHSDRRRERHLHTVVPVLVFAAAYAVMATRQSVAVVVIAYAIGVVAGAAAQATFWLIPADEFRGHVAEVGVAAIGSIGMIGAFLGPYTFGWTRDHTGNYTAGLLLVSVLYVGAAAAIFYMRSRLRIPVPVARTEPELA